MPQSDTVSRRLHPVAVGLGTFVVEDPHNAVVLYFEHIVSDGLADAVPGALIEVDLDPHQISDPGVTTERTPARV